MQKKYPGRNATPIEKIEFHYTLSKKSASGVKNAIAIQFPLRLAFAATSHKVQGQTVKKPNNLVIDLRTVKEAAQGYVMLSRVQSLQQLFILETLPVEKIYSSATAMEELERLKSIAVNNADISTSHFVSCNIRSIEAHLEDLKASPYIKTANVICLQETWLKEDFDNKDKYKICDYKSFFCSVGNGKGVATYCNKEFSLKRKVKKKNHQMLLVASTDLNIINIYRSSSSESPSALMQDLSELFDEQKTTIIVGDMNICSKEENNHTILKHLRIMRFKQKAKSPSHIAGRYIDHVHFYSPQPLRQCVEVSQFGQFFTDHDLMVIQMLPITKNSTIT